jgi:hypothetical protein
MNERIRELWTEVCQSEMPELDESCMTLQRQAKFAELMVRECKENFAKVWYEQGVDCRGAELDKFMTRFDQHFGVEE